MACSGIPKPTKSTTMRTTTSTTTATATTAATTATATCIVARFLLVCLVVAQPMIALVGSQGTSSSSSSLDPCQLAKSELETCHYKVGMTQRVLQGCQLCDVVAVDTVQSGTPPDFDLQTTDGSTAGTTESDTTATTEGDATGTTIDVEISSQSLCDAYRQDVCFLTMSCDSLPCTRNGLCLEEWKQVLETCPYEMEITNDVSIPQTRTTCQYQTPCATDPPATQITTAPIATTADDTTTDRTDDETTGTDTGADPSAGEGEGATGDTTTAAADGNDGGSGGGGDGSTSDGGDGSSERIGGKISDLIRGSSGSRRPLIGTDTTTVMLMIMTTTITMTMMAVLL